MTWDILLPVLIEWGSLLLRWLHVITAIAWIGSSFYFMHIDAALRPVPNIVKGGEAWEVHGGGFYQVRKYLVAPEKLPDELIWHKWQSYSTWISGFFLLVWIYYAQSELYLLDPEVLDIPQLFAAAMGIAALVAGWLIYDLLSRALARNEFLLAAAGLLVIVATCFLFQQIFSGRGALIHTGAVMATWMTANVAMVIIPNQRKVIASLMKGETPDPALGLQAKQRSTHNNYLTLPVLFLMLSNHYPLTSSTPYAWAIVGCVTVAGALVRVFYNLRHSGQGNQWWTWGVATLLVALAIGISLTSSAQWRSILGQTAAEAKFESVADVPQHVQDIVAGRCAMCHAREPLWPNMTIAPKGIYLETAIDINRYRQAILNQSVLSHAMPPNNIAAIEQAERQQLYDWIVNQPGAKQ
jgi:uncharacterized membrane protein